MFISTLPLAFIRNFIKSNKSVSNVIMNGAGAINVTTKNLDDKLAAKEFVKL